MRIAWAIGLGAVAICYLLGWGLFFSSPGGVGYGVLSSTLRVQVMFTLAAFGYAMLPVLAVVVMKAGEEFPWPLAIFFGSFAVLVAMVTVW
jgi:hypothetical protein